MYLNVDARTSMNDARQAFGTLLAALDRLAIRHAAGGSLASSVHGIPRATVDIDLLVDLREQDIAPLAAELGKDFYADANVIREAVGACRPFNLIHYESSYKFDLFPLPEDPYYQGELDRRTVAEFSFGEGPSLRFPVVTAEDTVLTKLVWYQMGGEVSERQWNDLLGIVRVRGQALDQDYLRRWAEHLGVAQLLQRVWETGR